MAILWRYTFKKAITDHDSVQAFPEVYKVLVNTRALENNGIKLIYGTEIYYKRENKKYNVSILAKNQQGLKKLYKILSEASSSEERTIVTIESLDSVLTDREYLVFGITLMDELLDLIIDGKSDSEFEDFIKMQDSIKDVLENEDVEHYKIAILELFNDMINSGYVFDMEKVNSQDFSEVFVKEASK